MATYISIISAIQAINPVAQVRVDNDDINQIIWKKGTPVISNEDILAKQVELRAEYDAKQYQRDRTARPEDGGYPSMGDQLDMQYHDLVDGTSTWEDAIQAIKDAHPKP
mgnify:CR=1 FL=1|tara:strand:+ start:203 stop:529 length:327 start_codon:yes stop_codon:yes gene_type:complete